MRSKILKIYVKDKGAPKRKKLKYRPTNPVFMAWQQLILTNDQQKRQNKAQKQQVQAED